MKTVGKALALLLGVFACAVSHAATYSYTAGNFTGGTDFTPPCLLGSCANYTTAMRAQGTFTTSGPLPANQPLASIAPLITGFSFSDGLVAYNSTDPQVHILNFLAATDATGAIVQIQIALTHWQTPGPHVLSDRAEVMYAADTFSQAYHNERCLAISPPGRCTGFSADAGTSITNGPGALAVAMAGPAGAQSVPTLGETGLLLAAALVGMAGLAGVARQAREPR